MTLQPVSREALAKQLLAEVSEFPVESETDISLADIDRVWKDDALRAIEKALSRSLPVDEALVERMREVLQAAQLQLEYLDGRFPTGTTPPTIAKIEDVLRESLNRPALTKPASIGDVERLRRALIECGRAAGALLADDVSTDFLMHIPEEVKGKIASLSPVVGEEG